MAKRHLIVVHIVVFGMDNIVKNVLQTAFAIVIMDAITAHQPMVAIKVKKGHIVIRVLKLE